MHIITDTYGHFSTRSYQDLLKHVQVSPRSVWPLHQSTIRFLWTELTNIIMKFVVNVLLSSLFHVFTDLRLQLLDAEHNPFLLKSLYGLLMLLPQSTAFNTLHNRLTCVPNLQVLSSTAPAASKKLFMPGHKTNVDNSKWVPQYFCLPWCIPFTTIVIFGID